MTAPLFIRKPGVAALLGISIRTLNRLIAGGKFGPQPVRLGGSAVFNVHEVEAWSASAVNGELPDRSTWAAMKRKSAS